MKALGTFISVFLLAGSLSAQNTAYVGGAEVTNQFDQITAEHMDTIRTKKILYGSRSFGLNVHDGLNGLISGNSMYNLNKTWAIDMNNGTDIPADIFDTYDVVHYLCQNQPPGPRIFEMDSLVRNHFGNEIDAIFLHTSSYMDHDLQDTYFDIMDSLKADFPHIQVIYGTSNIYITSFFYDLNVASNIMRNRMLDRYRGKAPVLDLAAVYSSKYDGSVCTFTSGDTTYREMCDEYNINADGTHPNSATSEERMGKAFLLMLAKLFCDDFITVTDSTPPTAPSNLAGSALSPSSVRLTWNAAADPQSGIWYYRILRNGQSVGSSYAQDFTDAGLDESTQYSYGVRAVNTAGLESSVAGPVQVTTMADTTPPAIVRISDTRDSATVSIEFDEDLDQPSAETPGNYSVDQGITVTAAVMSGRIVTLTLSPLTAAVIYTLTVNGVTDNSAQKNAVPGAQETFKYVPIIFNDDAVGYWSFDDTLADLSGNGNHGSWVGTASYTDGYAGSGLDLDGTSDGPYPVIGHDDMLDSMAYLTVSLWAKKSDAAVGGQLFKKHVTYDLEISDDAVVGYLFNAQSGRVNISATVSGINNTDWHHYCLTYDGSDLVTYVDAVEVDRSAQTDFVNHTSNSLNVGKDPWGNTFAGSIDELKIFDRALDSLEIVTIVNGGSGANRDSLAVRAILDANGLTGTAVMGATTWEGSRVTGLYINEAGVTDLTANIGTLTELEILQVYGDTAQYKTYLSTIPPEIGSCTKLTTIGAYNNAITSLPTELGNLSSLQILNLHNNLLTSVPAELGNLTALKTLVLSDNDLTGLPDELTNLEGLTYTKLFGNKLCDLSADLTAWADTMAPGWDTLQDCGVGRVDAPVKNSIPGVIISGTGSGIEISHHGPGLNVEAVIFTMSGIPVYRIQHLERQKAVWQPGQSGLYLVEVKTDSRIYRQKAAVVR